MVQFSPHRPRRWNIVSLALVALLVSLSLAACSSPGDDPPTATHAVIPTQSPMTSPASATVTASETTVTGDVEPTQIPATVAQKPTTELDPQAMTAAIAELVSDTSGLVEVVVSMPDGTTLTEINSNEPIEAASLYKLAIMVELFAEREMGELSFDEEIVIDPAYFAEEDSVFVEDDIGYAVSIETLLQTMITLSSNVAATALLARVGNENVNLTMASLGLTATEIRWSPGAASDDPSFDEDDPVSEEPAEETEEPAEEDPVEEPTVEDEPAVDEEPTEEEGSGATDRSLLRLTGHRPLFDPRADAALNVTTAADIAALYVMLINGQVISEPVSHEMLVLLEDQQINDRLPAYLPAGTVVAHKTGNLDGLVHDAGVIFAPNGPIVVVVLTEDVEEWQAIDLIASVARLAYDAGS
ncbi:MAG TPA: serine hydrolase [Thermomicrobiales bacterium]|nr:serine hydrolase [Thermomicrobiales bacterium]